MIEQLAKESFTGNVDGAELEGEQTVPRTSSEGLSVEKAHVLLASAAIIVLLPGEDASLMSLVCSLASNSN